MPYARNKIIINSFATSGMALAIGEMYKALDKLAEEIQDMGYIAETAPLRDELKKACDAHIAADWTYYKFLCDFANKLTAFIESKIQQPVP